MPENFPQMDLFLIHTLSKENFLLKRLKKELLEIIEVLKEQKMYTDFKNAYYAKPYFKLLRDVGKEPVL